MIVYKITNLINSKIYIGQTTRSIDERWKSHLTEAKYSKKNHVILNAIRKYGKENFKIEQIDSASDINELNKKEIYWIDKNNSLVPNGYNLRNGGLNGKHHRTSIKKRSGKNHPFWKEKIEVDCNYCGKRKRVNLSRAKRNDHFFCNINCRRKWMSKNRRGKNNPMYGKHPSEETRKKQSESHKGLQAGKKHPFYGKHFSEETRRKQSKIRKGKYSGEKNPAHKLKEKDVQWIKEIFNSSDYIVNKKGSKIYKNVSYGQISKLFGISSTTLCDILNNKIWIHIKLNEELEKAA